MKRISNHLRASAVGYVALFVALSATAYAAGLAPNSVKSKHIKDGQVTTTDVADASLFGADIADSSLDGADIASDSIGASELGTVTTRFGSATLPPSSETTVTASCQAGEELLGGGGGPATAGANQLRIVDSQRVGTSNTWTVSVESQSGDSNTTFVAEAYCLG